MITPAIFLSAATDDLKKQRELLHSAFDRAGFKVFTQDISMGASTGDVLLKLRTHIDQSDYVVHLAGLAYGAEPEQPPFPDASDFRCSYTQFEYYYAHHRKKQVIAFVCAPDFPYDSFTEKGRDDADRERRRGLQLAHRGRVSSGRFTETPLAGLSYRPLSEPIADIEALLVAVAAAVGAIRGAQTQQDSAHALAAAENDLVGLARTQTARLKQLREYLDRTKGVLISKLGSRHINQSLEHYIERRFCLASDQSDIDPVQNLLQGIGFVIVGRPGSGKSTSFYVLALRLIEESAKRAAPVLPVLVEAADVVASVHDQLTATSPASYAVVVVRNMLLEQIFRQLQKLGFTKLDASAIHSLLSDSGIRIILLFDGFDELIAPRLEISLRIVVTDQLRWLATEFDITMAIIARDEMRSTLSCLDIPVLNLQPFEDKQLEEYFARSWKNLQIPFATAIHIFHQKLASRPLYLYLLCKYYSSIDKRPVDSLGRVALLRWFVDEQIAANLRDLRDERADVWQRSCLRSIAVQMLTNGECDQSDLDRVLDASDAVYEAQAMTVLKRFLVEESNRWRFFHLDFRDFWVADAIFRQITVGAEQSEAILLLVLQEPRLINTVVELMAQDTVTTRQRSDAKSRLLNVLANAPASREGPLPRWERTIATAALSLLVRLFSKAIQGLDCQGHCMQGLLGAGQDFTEIRLAKANLRESDLRGAVFDDADLVEADLDNADLRGASFRNADLRNAILGNAHFDPQDQYWHPELDRKHLRFGNNNDVDKIRGLSPRYLSYLKRLG